jgi:A/G-specific adenine glycosylase
MDDTRFRKLVLTYFRLHGRDLPWRRTSDPYCILVSEIMLQQTQVDRVISKYEQWLKLFPTFTALANAPTTKVLMAWQGLGYNRRALALQRCAAMIVQEQEGLLPGIGPYTAGAVLAFAFNKPVPIIETNIRRVYLHHYFAGKAGISDAQLLPIIERTLDMRNPRRWYWALMDYGSFLKSQIPNPNWRSQHYAKQAKFEGSRRQLRGEILRQALSGGSLVPAILARAFKRSVTEVRGVLSELSREGLIAVY